MALMFFSVKLVWRRLAWGASSTSACHFTIFLCQYMGFLEKCLHKKYLKSSEECNHSCTSFYQKFNDNTICNIGMNLFLIHLGTDWGMKSDCTYRNIDSHVTYPPTMLSFERPHDTFWSPRRNSSSYLIGLFLSFFESSNKIK